MTEIVIASATRTAIGKFGGSLAKVPFSELGAIAIRCNVARAGLQPEQISEVIMGQVIPGQFGSQQIVEESGTNPICTRTGVSPIRRH